MDDSWCEKRYEGEQWELIDVSLKVCDLSKKISFKGLKQMKLICDENYAKSFKDFPHWLFLPSFLVFASISLAFQGCFADIYLFHSFPSASACLCVWLLLVLQLDWTLNQCLNSNHIAIVKALSLAWGAR